MTSSTMNDETTCLILSKCFHFATKMALTLWGVGTGPLGVSCGGWHRDGGSGSFVSCVLWGSACHGLLGVF